MTISGYAAVFHDPSRAGTEFDLGGGCVERIMPGAFDDALQSGADVVGLFNHDPNMILGRRSAGTLQLEVDSKGLKYTISEGTSQVSRDVQSWQQRGELRGSSFGFKVTKQQFTRAGGKNVREIRSVALLDVGPVTYPAYSGTGNGIQHRCVTPDGYCEAVASEAAHECRSAIMAGLDAWDKEREREAVEVRARAVALDAFKLF